MPSKIDGTINLDDILHTLAASDDKSAITDALVQCGEMVEAEGEDDVWIGLQMLLSTLRKRLNEEPDARMRWWLLTAMNSAFLPPDEEVDTFWKVQVITQIANHIEILHSEPKPFPGLLDPSGVYLVHSLVRAVGNQKFEVTAAHYVLTKLMTDVAIFSGLTLLAAQKANRKLVANS